MPSIQVREIVPELSERLQVETLSGYACADVLPGHLPFLVEQPCFFEDHLHDDLGKFALDVTELSPKSMTVDICSVPIGEYGHPWM